ncbi:MAG: esterase family protein [Gemmatimonadetes bacterium]|nr:esterase family protein [Gemmatimonadota bacterium]
MTRRAWRRRGLAVALSAASLSAASLSAASLSVAGLGMAGLGVAVFAPVAAAQDAPAAVSRGTVRTDTMWANAIGAHKALRIYLPPSYGSGTRRYPVLLYLHGLGGNERNWVDNGQLDRMMDSLVAAGAPEAIIAMPDGDDSWYTTFGQLPDVPACQADTTRREPAATFCVPWPRYDDYIVRDVVAYLDGHYRTRADRAHRAIAGLSMGGYGAFTLAFRHPEVFAAVASHSGVLSTRLLPDAAPGAPNRYATTAADLQRAARGLWKSQRLAFWTDTIAWKARDPVVIAQRLAARVSAGTAQWPAIYFDVGADDPWLAHNRDFNATLAALGVPRRYGEFAGGHTWTYWRTHAEDSLGFLLAIVGK